MEGQYNISELFSAAFGYGTGNTPIMFNPNLNAGSKPSNIYFDLPQISSVDQAVELSQSGTPILFPITFVGRGYNKYDKSGKIVIEQMQDFRLPSSAIMEIERSKALTTTPLSGGVGEVTEMYGFENWDISIKGICFNEPKHPQAKTPTEQKGMLYKWDCLADSIDVRSDLLLALDITSITIGSIRFSQLPGKPDFIPFEISCKSEQPVELFGL
ncbi:MAG: DUF6046 domain-containing protein [Chitinophagales bacterium]